AHAGGDVRRLKVGAAAQEGLEEARRLVDVQLGLGHPAVVEHDAQRPFALDPGERAYFQKSFLTMGHDWPSSPSSCGTGPHSIASPIARKTGSAGFAALSARRSESGSAPSASSSPAIASMRAWRVEP